MNYVIYKALDEMFVGGILWFILRGVEKYACRRDADHVYARVFLCYVTRLIDKAR